MSLVNDALKRAKEAQDKQTGNPMRGAPLHTPAPAPSSKLWLVALFCFVLAIGVAVGGIWYYKQHGGNFSFAFLKPKAEADTKTGSQIIIVTQQKTNVLAQKSSGKFEVENPPLPPAETPKPAPAPIVEAKAEAPVEKKPDVLIVDKSKPLNLVPQVAVEKPAPIQPPQALKLQGILYSATKPAAILNGRTIFVGDHFSDMTVAEISQTQVTLIYSNQPIVLKLP